tara:strand:+ start:892 stop:1317 length:426 start_codon:yes stop_codon:yes gene_type:complete
MAPFKMKGFSGFKQVSGKSLDDDMEGPIDRKNLKLQPGENDATYVFGRNYGDEGTSTGEGFEPTGTKKQKFTAQERINDLEERASYMDEDMELGSDKYLGGPSIFGNPKKGKKVRATKQKTKENLEMEAEIMRDRRKNERK